MLETSISLLDRLQQGAQTAAWKRLVDLYTPLIRGWLRRHAVPDHDVDDLVQEVLAIVVRKLPVFKRKARPGAFRSWLRHITVNCLRDFWRSRRYQPRMNRDFSQVLEQLEDPESPLSQLWNQEHDHHLLRSLLARIQPRFEAKTWLIFQRVALEGASVDQVAADLGVSVNAIFIAKSRVLNQLRQEGQGLIE